MAQAIPQLHPNASNIASKGTAANPTPVAQIYLDRDLVDAKYVTSDGTLGESHSLPPTSEPRTGQYVTSLKGVNLYSVRGTRVASYLKSTNTVGPIEFIDCRGAPFELLTMKASNGAMKRAKHIPMLGGGEAEAALKKFKEKNPGGYSDLLKAKYVVVYCVVGQDRSPAMVLAYAAAWNQAAKNDKNCEQNVCLLNNGFKNGWKTGKGDDAVAFKLQTVTDPTFRANMGKASPTKTVIHLFFIACSLLILLHGNRVCPSLIAP
ncbi:hypothetical protein DOTSEDRAFT_25086 [Dothistroma septosporum NZE10]|uniref:Rhodanese domain-containing protein n=1 Tax=Dothistroma septosporum (strain NZE10 / CBS 128990) TaxID=675120 RepID=M2YMF9_DOTSN|nr:hypothetical protein DOTSEDRAFT_25086 [Dothistroma septosporum NZE10]